MKKIILIIVIASFFYNCEKPGDCVKSTGEMVTREVEITAFETIFVYTGIGLVIKQGPEYKVEVKSGENLIDDIVLYYCKNKTISFNLFPSENMSPPIK